MALVRDGSYPSPNYSSRGGAGVRLVVLHTAEGALTYQSLGNFFASPSAGVSSHTGIDDTPGVVGEYVPPGMKAWTAADANPYAVQTELCAFAAWSPAQWDQHPVMLQNAASWVAEECARFGIPIRALSAGDAQGGASGVCQHNDLGAMGGGHWDCGPGFPMARVIDMAAGGAPPTSQAKRKGHSMIASPGDGTDGYVCARADGAVYCYGSVEFHGGANYPPPGHIHPPNEVIGVACHGRTGYWLFSSDGGVYSFGSAPFLGRPDR